MENKIRKCLEFRSQYHARLKYYNITLHLIINALLVLIPLYFTIKTNEKHLHNIFYFIMCALIWAIAEYIIHRFTLHRKAFTLLYKEHTLTHHFFYTSQCQDFKYAKDLVRVFFHPPDIIILTYFVNAPLSFIIYQINSGFGITFFVVGIINYILYEIFHFIYHTPKHYIFHRIPLLKQLIRHHQIHHDQEFMGKYNFSLMFPILDIIFKTKKY